MGAQKFRFKLNPFKASFGWKLLLADCKLTIFIVKAWHDEQESHFPVKKIAERFHDLMAPIEPKEGAWRSKFRIDFMSDILQTANKILDELTKDSSWEIACSSGPDKKVDMETHPLVHEHLVAAAQTLIRQLEQRPNEPGCTRDRPELLFLVFDEAANLWVCPDGKLKDGTHYFVLRRVLRMLREMSVWSFFLSTESSTEAHVPSWVLERSDRIKVGNLQNLEPFLAFPLDVEASQALENDYDAELRKPMSEFATAKHMTMFGRPLWRAYSEKPHLLTRIASKKLICHGKYDPLNVNHVFAALSSRLCLDVCMEGEPSISLAHKAVNSHLRIVLSIESAKKSKTKELSNKANTENTRSLERMITTTPSEPVVAEAVANMFFGTERSSWAASIITLANSLLGGGLVQKGTKGELFARLLCILTRDFYLREVIRPQPKAKQLPYSQPFSVKSFLESLFDTKWLETIKDFAPAKPNTRQQTNSQIASFSEVFDKGMMNFTHFTNTDIPLQDQGDLLHNLLRQQAALQLAFHQPVWDILIPVYFGNLDSDFDPSRASAILISVKNRIRPSPFSLQSDLHHYAQFAHTDDPILFILMDLGSQDTKVVVDCLPKGLKARGNLALRQHIFGIHAEGVGPKIYRCFQDSELWRASGLLLDEVIQRSDRENRIDHDEICQLNKRFNYFSWESRFPAAGK